MSFCFGGKYQVFLSGNKMKTLKGNFSSTNLPAHPCQVTALQIVQLFMSGFLLQDANRLG